MMLIAMESSCIVPQVGFQMSDGVDAFNLQKPLRPVNNGNRHSRRVATVETIVTIAPHAGHKEPPKSKRRYAAEQAPYSTLNGSHSLDA
jgi:hypothetical protein